MSSKKDKKLTYIRSGVHWSTTQANVGDSVELIAAIENVKDDTTVEFKIGEYSGKPPREGGGSRFEEIDTLPGEVDTESGEAKATWQVLMVREDSPTGGFPEYQFKAILVQGQEGVASDLLTLGDVTEVDWEGAESPPSLAQAKKKGTGHRFKADQLLGMFAKVTSLKDFVCHFTIYKKITGSKGEVSFEQADEIRNKDVNKGAARAIWTLASETAEDVSATQFVFEVRLSKDGVNCKPKKFRSSVAEIVVEPELIDINTGDIVFQADRGAKENIAWIQAHGGPANGPVLPKLEASLRHFPEHSRIFWKLEVTFKRPKQRKRLELDRILLPADGSFVEVQGDQRWQIHTLYNQLPPDRTIFGGDAVLTYKVGKEGKPQSVKFRILGKNPDNAKARAFIDSLAPDRLWYAHAICKHEVRNFGNPGEEYCQFQGSQNSGDRRIRGEPVWGLADSHGPGGVGLFQVTGLHGDVKTNLPAVQLWNWQENVVAGLEILLGKMKEADKFILGERKQMMSDQKKRGKPPLPPPVVQYGAVTFEDGTPKTIEDAEAIRGFNGGKFCTWSSTARRWQLHEVNDRGIYYVREVCKLY